MTKYRRVVAFPAWLPVFFVRIIDRDENRCYYITLVKANRRVKHGIRLNSHIDKDMMHCWGAMEFEPETRAFRQKYFKEFRVNKLCRRIQ